MSFGSSAVCRVSRWHWSSPGIGYESFKPAFSLGTMCQRLKHHPMRNACFGRRILKRRKLISMAPSATQRTVMLRYLPSAGSMLRLWPLTTDNLSSGRRIARKISPTGPRWSAPSSLASKVATPTRCAFTSRPSAPHMPTALSTMRRLHTR